MANATVSAPKQTYLLAILFGLAAAVTIIGLFYWQQQNGCKLKLSRSCYSLEYATTVDQHTTGLGNRSTLANDHGMIFIFDQPQKACFWMKNTKFSLDIIWVNQTKQVTKIEKNLSPTSYPQAYCSDNDTSYVIELSAGSADANSLSVSQQLKF
ncbi:MAG: DUF192 domain-containing protein [Candidatus Saccharimonadales bacterium]